MYCTNVRHHMSLLCEHLRAPVHVARKRLRECVRDAVLRETCFSIESLLAQITNKCRSVVHALVGDHIAAILVCFVAFRAFKGVHRA